MFEFVEEGETVYVISRVLKCEKREHSIYKNHFMKPSPLDNFQGFIRKELLINSNQETHDLVKLFIYFESKKSFYQWEGSLEHIALHKDKESTHHHKLDRVIEAYTETYDSLGTVEYSEKS